jgi:hypothetical protein
VRRAAAGALTRCRCPHARARSQARRHGPQTSAFRGVSLLKQTGKWHAQINVAGKQLHLGFFSSEEAAARAYDRAAIHKAGAAPGPPPPTNFEVGDYAEEADGLRRMTQQQLLALLAERRGSGGAGGGEGDGAGEAGGGAGGAGGAAGGGAGGAAGARVGAAAGLRRFAGLKRGRGAPGRRGGSGSGDEERERSDGGAAASGSGGSAGTAGRLAPRLPDIFPRGKGRRTRRPPCQAPAG